MNEETNLPATTNNESLPSKDEYPEAAFSGQRDSDSFAMERLTYESVRGTAPAAIASEQRKYGDHRRALEMMRANADIAVTMAGIDERKRDSAEARVGQVCALIICLASIAAGAITAIYGHDWAGSAIGVGGIGGIVTTFIVGRRGQQKASTPDSPANANIRAKNAKRSIQSRNRGQ
jgi:hypothetical protein